MSPRRLRMTPATCTLRCPAPSTKRPRNRPPSRPWRKPSSCSMRQAIGVGPNAGNKSGASSKAVCNTETKMPTTAAATPHWTPTRCSTADPRRVPKSFSPRTLPQQAATDQQPPRAPRINHHGNRPRAPQLADSVASRGMWRAHPCMFEQQRGLQHQTRQTQPLMHLRPCLEPGTVARHQHHQRQQQPLQLKKTVPWRRQQHRRWQSCKMLSWNRLHRLLAPSRRHRRSRPRRQAMCRSLNQGRGWDLDLDLVVRAWTRRTASQKCPTAQAAVTTATIRLCRCPRKTPQHCQVRHPARQWNLRRSPTEKACRRLAGVRTMMLIAVGLTMKTKKGRQARGFVQGSTQHA